MKANELRVGNFIMDRGNKVWQIDCWEHSAKVAAKEPIIGICDFSKKTIFGHPLTEEVAFLKPIPLTEEWLLKFGFEKTNESKEIEWYEFNNFEVSTYQEGENVYFVYQHLVLRHITKVHQFQNLYFVLTGEELILNN